MIPVSMRPDQVKGLAGERVLVVGGSGWVGRAIQVQLRAHKCDFMCLNSRVGEPGDDQDFDDFRSFEPSTVLFLAGITPDRGAQMGVAAYRSALEHVTVTLERVLSLPGLRHVCYTSSGIVALPDLPESSDFRALYKSAKAQEEATVLACQSAIEPLIARVYSLSGPFVQRPENFALYDFILQSSTGSINVTSDKLVYRSYVSVVDLAGVLLSSVAARKGGIFATGGQRIELAELACRVAEALADAATVTTPSRREGLDSYCGDDVEWRRWCAEADIVPGALKAQILESAQWLQSEGRI